MSEKKAAPQGGQRQVRNHQYFATASADRETERARSALWSIPADTPRPDWVETGMAAKDAGLTFDDFDQWSAQAGNYDPRDCRDTWRSFKPGKGIGPGTLFKRAKEHGWTDGATKAPPRRNNPKPTPSAPEKPKHTPAEVWKACEPATAQHGYIIRKGGRPEGLRVYRGPLKIAGYPMAGRLVIPARDASGTLQTLQFIDPERQSDGKGKLNLPGCPVAGWHTVGELKPGEHAYIVEGIGQAWTTHAATGCAALVAFGSHNMERVAQAAQTAGARPVLVADRGKEEQAQETAERLHCAWVAMPDDLPANGDINDIQAAEGIEAASAILAQVRQPEIKPLNSSGTSFGFTRVADMLHHLKPIDWLVRGYLEADSLALLFGDPGCGKSFVAIDLACSVATGSGWHGKATTPGAVFYIAGEGHNGLARRFKAWEALNDRSLADAPLYASHRSASLYDATSAAAVSEAVQALAEASGQHPRLIVVDTLARNFGGADENSTSDMNAFVSNLDAFLKDRFHACVLIVHHTGHADKSRARGAMALKGALDAEYQLEKGEDGLIRWNTTKMKDAEHPEPLSFRLDRVELPFLDEDGQPVFGAAPVSAAYVPPSKPGKAGRGKHQTAALKALAELEREHRERLESAGHDSNEALVKLESWENRLLRDLQMDRRRVADVRSSLIEQGVIEIIPGGYIRAAA